jgi:hypothetical protein
MASNLEQGRLPSIRTPDTDSLLRMWRTDGVDCQSQTRLHKADARIRTWEKDEWTFEVHYGVGWIREDLLLVSLVFTYRVIWCVTWRDLRHI